MVLLRISTPQLSLIGEYETYQCNKVQTITSYCLIFKMSIRKQIYWRTLPYKFLFTEISRKWIPRCGSTQVCTVLRKSDRFVIINIIIFNNINKNKLPKLKSRDKIIRRSARLSSGENRTCHWPGLLYHSLLMVNPHWPPPRRACPPQPPRSLHLQHSFGKSVSIYSWPAPAYLS